MLYRIPNWCAALLAGIIFPLGLAPFDFWPAIPLSTGLLYAALIRSQRTQYGRCGYAYGAGFFHRRVLGVCQHPRLWQHARLAGSGSHRPILRRFSAAVRRSSDSFRPSRKYPYDMANYTICLALGAF